MPEHKHYVPILKSKEGELKALQVTKSATKANMTPLLEIVKIDFDYKLSVEKKTIEYHLTKIAKNILKNWGTERKIFIDSPLIDNSRKMSDGVTHHLVYIFDDLRMKEINAIPVTGLDRSSSYKEAVKETNENNKKGICLRLKNADFNESNLKTLIDADLNYYNVTPQETDVVIDLASIDSNTAELLPLTISLIINNKLPYLNKWRTLILVSSSFPVNLSGIKGDSTVKLERSEWLLWKKLTTSGLKRIPMYGDYAISHPEILEMNPLQITMSASIRYTCDDNWLILKGRSTKTQGYGQFFNLSSDLISMPEYSGSYFSWGDDYISKCALRTVTSGNATTWRQVGCNHHFEKVIDQISILP